MHADTWTKTQCHIRKWMRAAYTIVALLVCRSLVHHLWGHLFFSMHKDVPLFCSVELFSCLLWWMSMMIRDSNTCVWAHMCTHLHTYTHTGEIPLCDLWGFFFRCLSLQCVSVYVSHGRWWWIIDLPDHVLFRSSTFLASTIPWWCLRSMYTLLCLLCILIIIVIIHWTFLPAFFIMWELLIIGDRHFLLLTSLCLSPPVQMKISSLDPFPHYFVVKSTFVSAITYFLNFVHSLSFPYSVLMSQQKVAQGNSFMHPCKKASARSMMM